MILMAFVALRIYVNMMVLVNIKLRYHLGNFAEFCIEFYVVVWTNLEG
jgi:hypothetical protein